MTILVLGHSGQLAQHLRVLLPEAVFWSRADADLSDPATLERAILNAAPRFIVNAAAYTAVDRAESERAQAWRVNAEAPAAIARAASALDIPLVHVSTDYVFDGRASAPYKEGDPTAPLSTYGATKLAGEIAVRTLAARYWILRTSWVFSEHGTNFVKTILRLAREKDVLKIVNDQRGRPTYAGDLAALVVALVRRPESLPDGLYHVGGGPVVSWYEFAGSIVESAAKLGKLSRQPALKGIPTADYPTPAARPLNSVLESNPIVVERTGVPFDWEAGLQHVLSLA